MTFDVMSKLILIEGRNDSTVSTVSVVSKISDTFFAILDTSTHCDDSSFEK